MWCQRVAFCASAGANLRYPSHHPYPRAGKQGQDGGRCGTGWHVPAQAFWQDPGARAASGECSEAQRRVPVLLKG